MDKHLIDIHSHFYPRWYLDLLADRGDIPKIVKTEVEERFVIFPGERGREISEDFWVVERKLAFMESVGITQTLLSLGNPWLDPFSARESVTLADRIHDEFSELAEATKNRIVGMGVLPHSNLDAILGAIERVSNDPNLVGIISGPRLGGLQLDDPGLDPVWEALGETGVPVLIHPHYSLGRDDLHGYEHSFHVGLGFPFETTAAFARAVFSGVLERHPKVLLIGSHGGGTLPYLIGRLDAAWSSDPANRDRLPLPPSLSVARLMLDVVLYHPGPMRLAAELVGSARLAFGTDHPFSVADPQANLAAIEDAFDLTDQHRVRHRTAQELLTIPPLGP